MLLHGIHNNSERNYHLPFKYEKMEIREFKQYIKKHTLFKVSTPSTVPGAVWYSVCVSPSVFVVWCCTFTFHRGKSFHSRRLQHELHIRGDPENSSKDVSQFLGVKILLLGQALPEPGHTYAVSWTQTRWHAHQTSNITTDVSNTELWDSHLLQQQTHGPSDLPPCRKREVWGTGETGGLFYHLTDSMM